MQEKYNNINTKEKYDKLLEIGMLINFYPELTGDYENDLLIITGDELELDDFGLLVFKHKTNKRLFLMRSYSWVDRLILLDETDGRSIVDDFKFSTFDLSVWEPVTKKEYRKVKEKFTDIYK